MEKRACFRTSYLVLKLKAIPLRDILRDLTETIKTNVDVLINRRIESFPKPKYIILHVKTISIFSNSRHSRQSRTTYVSIEEIYAEKNRISLLASYISRVFSHTRSKRVYIHLFLLHTLQQSSLYCNHYYSYSCQNRGNDISMRGVVKRLSIHDRNKQATLDETPSARRICVFIHCRLAARPRNNYTYEIRSSPTATKVDKETTVDKRD